MELAIAIIQGISEFLPISSSMHIMLAGHFIFNITDSLSIAIIAHGGSVIAVAFLLMRINVNWYLALKLSVICSLPIYFVGALIKIAGTELYDFIHTSIVIICIANVIAALVMLLADTLSNTKRNINDITIYDMVFMGLAQAMSIVPGVSRSGIVITVSRLLGINRHDTVSIAVITALPTLLGAIGFMIISVKKVDIIVNLSIVSIFFISMISSMISVIAMQKMVSKITYMPFCIYRIILSISILCL